MTPGVKTYYSCTILSVVYSYIRGTIKKLTKKLIQDQQDLPHLIRSTVHLVQPLDTDWCLSIQRAKPYRTCIAGLRFC